METIKEDIAFMTGRLHELQKFHEFYHDKMSCCTIYEKCREITFEKDYKWSCRIQKEILDIKKAIEYAKKGESEK